MCFQDAGKTDGLRAHYGDRIQANQCVLIGQGVRATDFVSSWPSGIHMGARYAERPSEEKVSRNIEADQLTSWNRDLSLQRAIGMGGEFRTKGVNVFLGPVVSPLGRTVTSGRNWEGK